MPIYLCETPKFNSRALPFKAWELKIDWYTILSHFTFQILRSCWHRSVAFNHPRPFLWYQSHFHFVDKNTPIEQLEKHIVLDSWPESHIPFFIPVEHSHWSTVEGEYFGSFVLICKEEVKLIKSPIAPAA